jgi:GTPase Era involved in 16S rRNA processing
MSQQSDTTPTNIPVLAVVGRVNKGKSSIIATLTENENVKISRRPGTTTDVVNYTVRLHGKALFRVVDTPGFEEAARMLHWLQERDTNAANRRAQIAAFLQTFRDTDDFIEERRLLGPIMDGAAILYVVDGTNPYRANYEAEMDILRRTGEPGIALINRIGEEDHGKEWRDALKQYFDLVRDFDAHDATFNKRMRLLSDIGTLKEEWREPLNTVVDALKRDRIHRLEEAAEAIAEMLINVETLTLSSTPAGDRPTREEKKALERKFHEKIRSFEKKTHKRIDEIYGHSRFRRDIDELEIEEATEEDLFDEGTWHTMGLSPQSEIGIYAATGAGLGLAADAAVGGLSGGAGAVFGGLTGAGVGALRVGSRFAEAGTPGGFFKALTGSMSDDKPKLRIGPHPSLNLPFVLLNRAFARLDLVRNWTHARQSFPGMADIRLGDLREQLSTADQRDIAKLCAKLRKQAREPSRQLREDVYEEIRRTVFQLLGSE